MQLLFIFFIFIGAIIVIARLASKTRPESERGPANAKKRKAGKKKDADAEALKLLDALVMLLLRKKLISEEELQAAFEEVINENQEKDLKVLESKESGPQ